MLFNIMPYCNVRESKHAAMSVAHQISAGLDAEVNAFSCQQWIVCLFPTDILRDVIHDLVRPSRPGAVA